MKKRRNGHKGGNGMEQKSRKKVEERLRNQVKKTMNWQTVIKRRNENKRGVLKKSDQETKLHK